MKTLLLLLSLTTVATVAESSEIIPTAPSTLQSIRQVVPPPTQTSWLDDNELETDLLVSLESNKLLKSLASVQSVNCEEGRCQILVENQVELSRARDAFLAHLGQHPEFGKSMLVSPNSDKANTKLLTFVFSTQEQMSSTH